MQLRDLLHPLTLAIGLASALAATNSTAQIGCAPGTFYGQSYNSEIYRLTLSGNTITIGPIVVPATPGLQGLAIADLGNGNAYYSSMFQGIVNTSTGGTFQTIYTDELVRPNTGGHGEYLYYQNMRTTQPNPLFANRIERFDGTMMTTIWDDNTLFQTTADLAVDDEGNAYFFTGTTAFQSTLLNVISSTGEMLAQMPVSFSGIDTYGTFIMGNTLYVACGPSHSTYPGKLLPFTISNGAATLGVPITIPSPWIGSSGQGAIFLNFADLATCAPAHIDLSTGVADRAPTTSEVIYVPATESVLVDLANSTGMTVTVHDAAGRRITTQRNAMSPATVSMDGLPSGIYIVLVDTDEGRIARRIMKR